MRLAPVAIFFRNDLAAATEAAAKQSLTTHAGVEAAEACRLLAHILVLAMRSSAAAQSAKDFPAGFLEKACAEFTSPNHSVQCLAQSKADTILTEDTVSAALHFHGPYTVIAETLPLYESEEDLKNPGKTRITEDKNGLPAIHIAKPVAFRKKGDVVEVEELSDDKLNFRITNPDWKGEQDWWQGWGTIWNGEATLIKDNWEADRNWNWRCSEYRYSPRRAAKDPEYVGSYALDCLAMALHCVWSTRSYEACVLKSANSCGDALS